MQKHNDDDGNSKKPERKTVEKNRRIHMKFLCYKLHSLLPPSSSSVSQPNCKSLITQENQFDRSITYIEQLRKRVEALKDKRDEIVNNGGHRRYHDVAVRKDQQPAVISCEDDGAASRWTVVVKELDGGLRVFLTGKSVRNIPTFSEVISIVEDGGAEVVKGGYTTVGDKVVYIVHAKERFTRIGIDKTSVYDKLYELTNRSS